MDILSFHIFFLFSFTFYFSSLSSLSFSFSTLLFFFSCLVLIIIYISLFFSAYYDDVLVGAICCRFETKEEKDHPSCNTNMPDDLPPSILNGKRLYVMTLGVLAPYRGRGIGEIYIIYHISITIFDLII